ncbi:MAG TPA: DNA-formamidopyrimidine glycosylase family protein [Candidatus Limnocylindrales bacterium]|nr:DNA-formamidopyrimidine glycosylase family protein [Candidatus Limnocylindrales bacterium]
MPELPDLAILADALDAALAGRQLDEMTVREPLVLRGTAAEVPALAGQRLESVRRRGKFLTFGFERDRLVVNAMLTGRLGLAGPGTKAWPRTAAALRFRPLPDTGVGTQSAARQASDRLEGLDRPARSRARVATPGPWPAGADWLPRDTEPVEMRYRDATRMGKLYLLPQGSERPVAGWEEQGPDADDPALSPEVWRQRISHHGGELKNLLRNQAFVAGIGNAYSDEILWAAKLAPYRTRRSLTSEEVDALYSATRQVLAWAVAELRRLVPPRLEVEQRGFLRVHGRAGQACQRCGGTISSIRAGGSETNFCRSCQR